jgi:hypothetical protein
VVGDNTLYGTLWIKEDDQLREREVPASRTGHNGYSRS